MENDEENANTHRQQDDVPRAKVPAKRWFFIAMIVYGLLALSMNIAVSMAEAGTISEESFIPGWTILFFTSFLYFLLLQSYLRWYHLFRFWIESGIIILAIGVSIDGQSEIADEMATSILAANFLCIIIIWIPFLIAASIQKGQKAVES